MGSSKKVGVGGEILEFPLLSLSKVELRDIARREFLRTTNRGLMEWRNHQYFHLDLLNYQGQEVVVGVNIHDPMWVQVRTKEGKFICKCTI